MLYFFLALVVGLIPAFIASSKGHNFFIWWLYGAAIFIVAIIHSIVLKPTEKHLVSNGYKKCPSCAELVKVEASICRFCNGELKVESIEAESDEEQKQNGSHELFEAVKNKDFSALTEILKKDIDINAVDENGDSALIHAVKVNDYFVLPKLIDAGSDVSLKNSEGKSANDYAIELGNKKCLRILNG